MAKEPLTEQDHLHLDMQKLEYEERMQALESRKIGDELARIQLAEKRQAMEKYSPVLKALPGPLLRRGVGELLSSAAGAIRYSEKLLRGCYLEERRPQLLRPGC